MFPERFNMFLPRFRLRILEILSCETYLTIGDGMVATGNFRGLAALARMKILISGTVWSLPNTDAATQKAQTQGAHKKGKRLSSPKYTGRKGK